MVSRSEVEHSFGFGGILFLLCDRETREGHCPIGEGKGVFLHFWKKEFW
jgi:hypothetical protein